MLCNATPYKRQATQAPLHNSEVPAPALAKALAESGSSCFLGNMVEDVSASYNIGKEIGYGRYGTVRLVSKKSYENKRFALKTISRTFMLSHGAEADSTPLLENEFEILKQVDHPNIIKFYEMFVDEKNYHLVTEFCCGGELFDHIIERGAFSEQLASKIVKQILSAIKHLHDRNICHRDLKPENILFESKSKEAQVKLIDFGLSKYFKAEQRQLADPEERPVMKTKIGTPYYMAPEVLDGEYDQTCDMWSLGVITYCMLCGYPPFNAETDLQLFRKIKTCDYEFHLPEWGPVSGEAKRFIENLLQLEPSHRLTPEQALAHPWITSRGVKAEHMSAVGKRILSRLALFQKPTLF